MAVTLSLTWHRPVSKVELVNGFRPGRCVYGGSDTAGELFVDTKAVVTDAVVGPLWELDQQPALHRTFADLTVADEAGILEFVKRFGHLGVREVAGDKYGETLADFAEEAKLMRDALVAADLVRTGNASGLREFAERGGLGLTASDVRRGPFPWMSRGSDAVRLQSQVEAQLCDVVTAKMACGCPAFRPGTRGGWQLILGSRTLLSGLWAQLADTLVEGLDARRCPEDGTWFVVRPADRRIFCSDACRMRDYRRRKAEEGAA